MRKIYVIAYMKNNLGDDLFVQYLISQYPEINFEIYIDEKINKEFINNFKNVNILKTPDYNIKDYDAIIHIGGSIFMEFDKSSIKRLKTLSKRANEAKQNNIPFFYVSSNFGPYQTQDYLLASKELFTNCEDVCFREEYSYNLFNDVGSVRYAPDLLFTYPIEKIEKIKDTIGISVINPEIKKLSEYKEDYYRTLENSIKHYIKNGKKITLFSYCEIENDDKTINELLERFSDTEKECITLHYYKGNTKEFIAKYAEMEYMICSRFHSMILSYILQQNFFVISYSEKINNVIKNLNLCEKYKTIYNKNEQYDVINLELFEKAEYKKIQEIKQKAKQQFDGINKFLQR